ncbi:tyrosine-type recombinase/integrase [Leisingera sp. D0M16]|uniref:tyrosine-type recombinase/integrase n=1 Tax=Leisingera coralii TaxID=3351347 RepID=UPI003B7C5932
MKRDLPPYVYRQRNGLYFQRRGWPSKKMINQDIGPDFWAEYAVILKGVPQVPSKRTWTKLIRSYQNSPRWSKLKDRTKKDYRKVLDQLDGLFGPQDPAKIQRKDIIRLRDANADRYRAANYLVQVIRVLLEHAIDEGWRQENPAKGISTLKSPYEDRKPWPAELIKKYRQEATGRELLLFELCVGTGQRIGDILQMKWGDIQDGGINLTQNKTGKRLWVPMTSPLRTTLETAPRRSVFLLTNHAATGPWSYRGASQAVRKVRESIGALEYDIHSLRYTTASELAIAGCSDELIASVTGQSMAMVAKYSATVRQKVRALKAQNTREQNH